MENKFNIGDRVWFTREDCHWIEIPINNGDEGVIVGNGSGYFHNSVDVNFGGASDEISADDLELVEPYDPKTAFLSELKGLLEKYGAEIELLSLDLDTTQLGITSGEFEVEYPIDIQQITADNIMDYDKE